MKNVKHALLKLALFDIIAFAIIFYAGSILSFLGSLISLQFEFFLYGILTIASYIILVVSIIVIIVLIVRAILNSGSAVNNSPEGNIPENSDKE